MAYLSFALWAWLLAPFVRRVVDYQLGWEEPNYVLLTPFLVSMVSALAILRPSRRAPVQLPPVAIFSMAAIAYGFVIGMVLHPSGEVIYGLVNWLAPLLFGLHFALHWRDYEAQKRWVASNAVWAVAVLGVYGLYQYAFAPAWDTYWLQEITGGLIDPSFGTPEPFKIRLWSTLNSPGPFANVMAAMLLLLFVMPSRWKLPVSVAGYASFLLSFVRTAWISWMLGLLLLLRGARPRLISRIVTSIFVVVALTLPVLSNPEIAPALSERIQSLTRIGADESFNERREMYRIVGNIVLHDPFGHGLRNQEIVNNLVVDSGFFVMLLSLGWLGLALYLLGIVTFVFRKNRARNDDLACAAEAICFAFLVQLVGGPVFSGVTGAIFWLCLGLTISADRHQAAQLAEPGPRVLDLPAPAWKRLQQKRV